eukprot:4594791-Heterocapsa_arctica.AAC.1
MRPEVKPCRRAGVAGRFSRSAVISVAREGSPRARPCGKRNGKRRTRGHVAESLHGRQRSRKARQDATGR